MRNLRMESWLLPDEESFYRWIEPVRDGWGAVVCAGAAFVVRRRALDEIGGLSRVPYRRTTSPALPACTGLEAAVFPAEAQCRLAAESMEDFVRRRQRWANGTLQSLGLPWPARACSSPGQRLAYMEGRHPVAEQPAEVGADADAAELRAGRRCAILLDQRAIIDLMLPLWGTVLLSIGWLNRNSRSAC